MIYIKWLFAASRPWNAELCVQRASFFFYWPAWLTCRLSIGAMVARAPAYVTAGDGFTCFGVWLEVSEESAVREATPMLATPRWAFECKAWSSKIGRCRSKYLYHNSSSDIVLILDQNIRCRSFGTAAFGHHAGTSCRDSPALHSPR